MTFVDAARLPGTAALLFLAFHECFPPFASVLFTNVEARWHSFQKFQRRLPDGSSMDTNYGFLDPLPEPPLGDEDALRRAEGPRIRSQRQSGNGHRKTAT
jgi:hypothetical protein